ncbi:hypothetical protein QFZ99_001981 [Paraburkholderia atlantica]
MVWQKREHRTRRIRKEQVLLPLETRWQQYHVSPEAAPPESMDCAYGGATVGSASAL